MDPHDRCRMMDIARHRQISLEYRWISLIYHQISLDIVLTPFGYRMHIAQISMWILDGDCLDIGVIQYYGGSWMTDDR